MNFRVGQKVVCVDDVPYGRCPDFGIKVGNLYTVEAVGLAAWIDGTPCIKLEGIRDGYPDDEHFWARRFRPVIERKTDISIFTAMLDDVKRRADA